MRFDALFEFRLVDANFLCCRNILFAMALWSYPGEHPVLRAEKCNMAGSTALFAGCQVDKSFALGSVL
jgi:hypothetical protein